MQTLGFVVRRLLEAVLVMLGGLFVLAAVWFALFTIGTPGCSVDLDDAGGVLAVRIAGVIWIALEVAWAVVVGRTFRRSRDEWRRVGIAGLVPLGAVVIWIAWGGATAMVLELIDAGEGSSACW